MTMPRVNGKAIVQALVYQINIQLKEEAEKQYFAEGIKMLTENTATITSMLASYFKCKDVEAKAFKKSLNELFENKKKETPEEVAARIIANAGIEVKYDS